MIDRSASTLTQRREAARTHFHTSEPYPKTMKTILFSRSKEESE